MDAEMKVFKPAATHEQTEYHHQQPQQQHEEQHRVGDHHGDGDDDDDDDYQQQSDRFVKTLNYLRRISKFIALCLVPMAIVAFIMSILVFTQTSGDYGLVSDSAFHAFLYWFPSLVETDDGMGVRIGSMECDSDYCDELESIYCDYKGALRTFERPSGEHLFCVCDGHVWKCETAEDFCVSNPDLPSGAELVEDCSHTASSETCGFTCSDNLIPSGVFTCSDGEWDVQYCVCSASDLASDLNNKGIFAVSNVDNCDHVMPGEQCDQWMCEGHLRPAVHASVTCRAQGWDIHGDGLCVCDIDRLHSKLALNGIDFIDLTGCQDTPAGDHCTQEEWECPHKLLQEGDFECDKKDGNWIIPDHPCACDANNDYTVMDIPGFESSCRYLSVGESCDYHSWECDEYLVPITSLECTEDGLQGECGCSLAQLEMADPLPSDDAILANCDKTPIGEECSGWTCRHGLHKECCKSPICEANGHWTVTENMCKGCDPDDLSDYGPQCDDGLVSPDSTCTILCLSAEERADLSGEHNFICPTGSSQCEATCLHDGSWDVPCECDPTTLGKKVRFAESLLPPEPCALGEKCFATCADPLIVLEAMVCDPWKGYTGACGCQSLGDELNCEGDPDQPACMHIDQWGCESYEVDEVCTNYCSPGLIPFVEEGTPGQLICCEDGWSFFDGTPITNFTAPLCGCDPCQAEGFIDPEFCTPTGLPMSFGDICSTAIFCPVVCDGALQYSDGRIECTATGAECDESVGDGCSCGCSVHDLDDSAISADCFPFNDVVPVNGECIVDCVASGEEFGQQTQSSICLPDGTWSFLCPTCTYPPPLPQFAVDVNCIFGEPVLPGAVCTVECACPLISSGNMTCSEKGWDSPSCGCDRTLLNSVDDMCLDVTPVNDVCPEASCHIGLNFSTIADVTYRIAPKCQLNGWSSTCGCNTDLLPLNLNNSFPEFSCTPGVCDNLMDCIVPPLTGCWIGCNATFGNANITVTCKEDGTWSNNGCGGQAPV